MPRSWFQKKESGFLGEITDSRTGAVNIQDELVASCATKKESAKNKTKHSTMVGYAKGTEEPTEGVLSNQSWNNSN